MTWRPGVPSYPATVVYVVDGDTIGVVISIAPILGLYVGSIDKPWRIRLKDCNANELHDPGGTEAASNLARILDPGTEILLHNIRIDQAPHGNKPPRWDADIECERFADLGTYLEDEGWVARYPGKGPKIKPVWPRPQDTGDTPT